MKKIILKDRSTVPLARDLAAQEPARTTLESPQPSDNLAELADSESPQVPEAVTTEDSKDEDTHSDKRQKFIDANSAKDLPELFF